MCVAPRNKQQDHIKRLLRFFFFSFEQKTKPNLLTPRYQRLLFVQVFREVSSCFDVFFFRNLRFAD